MQLKSNNTTYANEYAKIGHASTPLTPMHRKTSEQINARTHTSTDDTNAHRHQQRVRSPGDMGHMDHRRRKRGGQGGHGPSEILRLSIGIQFLQ